MVSTAREITRGIEKEHPRNWPNQVQGNAGISGQDGDSLICVYSGKAIEESKRDLGMIVFRSVDHPTQLPLKAAW